MRSGRILIVEDDMRVYEKMKRCLDSFLTNHDINVDIQHAMSLVGAKRAFRTYPPDIISTDMMYPMRDDGNLEVNAGAEFLVWVWRQAKIPAIIYSSSKETESKEVLEGVKAAHKFHKETPEVLILRKEFHIAHDSWARALIRETMKVSK